MKPRTRTPQKGKELRGPGDRACRDSEGLGVCGDRFVVDWVTAVNGPNSAEISGFVPTRLELIQLVKYWEIQRVADEFFTFLYGCSGFAESAERRWFVFSARRISRITELIGEVDVQKAGCEAKEEYGRTADPRYWAIFTNGTPAEQKALQDEVRRDLRK